MADELSEQDIFAAATEPEAPAQPQTPRAEPPAQPEAPADGGQPRDDQGRYTATADAPSPQEPPPQAPQPGQEPPANQPPPGVLEERRRRQEAEGKAQALDRQLAELTGRFSTLERLLQGQQQQPKQEPEPEPDFFEAPDRAVDHRVKQSLGPLEQAIQSRFEGISQVLAVQQFGQDAVDTAFAELKRRVDTAPHTVAADYQRIMSAPIPHVAMVKWHKQQQTMQRVGDDPEAWFMQEFERRLSTPEFQQTIAQKLRPAAPQAQPQVPNRPAPLVVLPSLNQAPGSAAPAPSDQGPASEEDIFAAAPARMGRRG